MPAQPLTWSTPGCDAQMRRILRILGILGIGGLLAMLAQGAEPPQLWLYCPTNLLVDANVDALGTLFVRAHQAGYTTILLQDSKFCRLGEMWTAYFDHIAQVKKLAADQHLTIIPCICPIGYSNDLLSRDPDLAEALPVRRQLFVVKGGVATVQADPPVALPALSDLHLWTWKDDVVVPDGDAVRVTDNPSNARLVETLTVAPFREYHISVDIKTQGYTGTPEIHILAASGDLNYTNLGASATEPWTQADITFNSLSNTTISIYFGQWGPAHGSLWWRNPRLEETGLVNLVRRPGAPLAITDEAGRPLLEGPQIPAISDPLMGRVKWPGDYDAWHQPPQVPASLPDGTRLRLSYFHTVVIGDGQVMICPSEPQTMQLIADHITRVVAAWGAPGYFLSHDEIRVLGWDQSCLDRHLTPGQILADNVRSCIALVHAAAPRAKLWIWSDMFDPNHNAHDHYYFVHGDLANSWLGLDPSVSIALWNSATAATSSAFFAQRGHRLLIAGYYDAPVAGIHAWLQATAGQPVDALMYTTWRGDYSQIEAFAAAARAP
jgi:hypothetical protein